MIIRSFCKTTFQSASNVWTQNEVNKDKSALYGFVNKFKKVDGSKQLPYCVLSENNSQKEILYGIRC